MSSDAAHAESVEFAPERANLFAAALFIAVSMLVIPSAPLYLVWLLLIPLAFIIWVLRARTIVGESGVDIHYAFRSGKSIAWEDVRGVGFKGSRALLTTTDGTEHPMPAVSFNSLPKLAEASRGRIPDALTAAQEAADDKVVIVHRDGQQIMVSQEEFAAREAAKQQRRDHHAPTTENLKEQ
ncbi:PH domain-containing protein [Corynebacterium sp.]|uniref:PH domain-containing protein n=1 Tax=Corynebacterium sp. TaxID=1720 RepID=UPI0026DEA285|nr:PH domain-containing protein [Corynebacterium sp.]MDO5511394.1 PH domain-containing protein [Corynebacterium sp.]